ncbi:MAG: ribosome maturation factor RimM [Gammaproteobacteria bacterium]|nr:ribosome maturation factor RimM [Gammaproteobacteria bacterium]
MLVSNPIILGRVAGLHGIKGWVKVFSYTKPREAILKYKDLILSQDDKWMPIRVIEGQSHGKSIILKLDGLEDRNQAVTLIDKKIATERNKLPILKNGHYYWSDLMGLKVSQINGGNQLGTVKGFIETGTHDVMVLEGDQEILIPFVYGKIIIDVDLTKHHIYVDWEWD